MSEPLTQEALERALALETDYKSTVERLLLELDEDRAEALQLLTDESRGAWGFALTAPPGLALLVGNAVTGTAVALATLGWRVVVLDDDMTRLRFGAKRSASHLSGEVQHVLGSARQAPFAEGSFDLVAVEGGDPGRAVGLERLARGERVLVADNRLAYKLSTWRRGRFLKPGPLAWLRAALRPSAGQRTLAGYRRMLGPQARSFALYPHADEFSHVVSLDAPRPGLTVGPQERKNLLKVVGKKLGLFPLLTPSFVVLTRPRGAQHIDRILDVVAERTGEPRHELELLVGTRSNTGLMMSGPPDEPGGWALHVGLGPVKTRQVAHHAAGLRTLARRFPHLPVPELVFEGEVEGLPVVVDRRIGGLSAPQLTGDLSASGAMFADAARLLATLTLGPPRPVTEEDFERLFVPRLTLLRDRCARPDTMREVEARTEALRGALVGQSMPRVFYHADLRPKHVQVEPDGRVRCLIDWGIHEEEFLPYVDLLHLVMHQRKQETGDLPRVAWGQLVAGDLRDHEQAALDDYGERLGLADGVRRALEEAYPLLVGGMAEKNWDYSRPRWLHEQYGI